MPVTTQHPLGVAHKGHQPALRSCEALEALLRAYLSPSVAAALLANPGRAELGGALAEVSVVFADLQGFTTFSEGVAPEETAAMLNRYHAATVPCLLDHGGTVVQFVGDALLAVWGAPAPQRDHAARAVRAAVAMQHAAGRVAAESPQWPRLRVGVNSGPAWVGTIGSELVRGFNVMGDAVNVAARLQQAAQPGQVMVGEATRCAAGNALPMTAMGELQVRGRRQPVRAYTVTGTRHTFEPHSS